MVGAQKRVKTIFLGVLLTAALAAPLSAQDLEAALASPPPEEGWVFVSLTTGGTEKEQKYFNAHLPESVKANKRTLASTMEESDLFITADLAYNYELRLQAITVQLHDSVTGEQIASNAMGYATVTDMDKWNDLLIEELMKDIPRYEHVPRVAEPPPPPPLTWAERLWGVDRYWLHLAPRVGGALRFYSPMKAANTVSGSFDIGTQFMVQAAPWLGIQTEALFTMDSAPQLSINGDQLNATNAKSTAYALTVPVVVMVTFRPDEWLIGPFGGAYINIPLGPMKTADGDSNYSWDSAGLGWTAGIEVGRKVGPGTLFTDIRYMSDFGDTKSDNKATVYRRSGVSISLGYEFSLFHKKPKGSKAK